jgi:hypothetical protein
MAKYGSWRIRDFEALLDKLGEDNAEKLIRGDIEVRFSESRLSRYPVTIDYPDPPSLLLDRLMKATRCDFMNRDINAKRFEIEGSGAHVVFLTLVEFGKKMTTAQVNEALKEKGLTRPRIEHGLAFSARYPNIQRQGPIAIFCSPWIQDGEPKIPYLDGDNNSRYLHLHTYDHEWTTRWRFLAVQKQ